MGGFPVHADIGSQAAAVYSVIDSNSHIQWPYRLWHELRWTLVQHVALVMPVGPWALW